MPHPVVVDIQKEIDRIGVEIEDLRLKQKKLEKPNGFPSTFDLPAWQALNDKVIVNLRIQQGLYRAVNIIGNRLPS